MSIPIISDILEAIVKPVKDIVSEVVVDKDKRNEINLELAKLVDQGQARLDAQLLAQIELNKVEAASGSLFVAGWRPAIGWVGAAALAYSFILAPFIGIWHTVPVLQFDSLYNIILAMLGIGAMRTYEKVKGVSTNNYKDLPKTPVEEPVVKQTPRVIKSGRWQL